RVRLSVLRRFTNPLVELVLHADLRRAREVARLPPPQGPRAGGVRSATYVVGRAFWRRGRRNGGALGAALGIAAAAAVLAGILVGATVAKDRSVDQNVERVSPATRAGREH